MPKINIITITVLTRLIFNSLDAFFIFYPWLKTLWLTLFFCFKFWVSWFVRHLEGGEKKEEEEEIK
jgi:hypothetical protein